MSISLTNATVGATRSLPELYAPAGGRAPSLATEGEDLATLDQTPQATAWSPPAPNGLPAAAPAAGSTDAAAGPDTMTSFSLASVQPSAAAAFGRDAQLGVNFDTLA